MTIELAVAHSLPKPWGVADSLPWSSAGRGDNTIGEIWYERSSPPAVPPALLLKLLFTDQPLSIQVHPDDAYAQSIGLLNGKTEAWYVLSASPEARVALGLKQRLTSQQLRCAAHNGSIAQLVVWQAAGAGDTFFVPAGTIHAIGRGLVVAEIQQRSDATFRLFDYARGRELHIEEAITVADAGPSADHARPSRLTGARILLTSNVHFTFEKIDLPPNYAWSLEATRETWLLVVGGSARAGAFDITIGNAIFAQSDCLHIQAGTIGFSALLAYTGKVIPELLQCAEMETAQ